MRLVIVTVLFSFGTLSCGAASTTQDGGTSDAGTPNGGAPDAGRCASIGSVPSGQTFNGYYRQTTPNQAVIAAEIRVSLSTAPPLDFVRLESFRNTTPGEPPLMYPTREFPLKATTVKDCIDCVYLFQKCTSNGVCDGTYLAQSGTLQFAAATETTAMGKFSGFGRGLEFVEWNLERDIAVPSGRCVTVERFDFAAMWK
jgi:hypothetical protein